MGLFDYYLNTYCFSKEFHSSLLVYRDGHYVAGAILVVICPDRQLYAGLSMKVWAALHVYEPRNSLGLS